MSLEQKVEELADAVRGLTAAIKAQGNLNVPVGAIGSEVVVDLRVEKPEATRSTKVKKELPPPTPASAGVTKEQLFDKLKEHGAAFGLKTTKALMVKFGADAMNTTTASVPVVSYQKLFDATVADLTKPAEKQEVFA